MTKNINDNNDEALLASLTPREWRWAIWIIRLYYCIDYIQRIIDDFDAKRRLRWITVYPAPVCFLFGVFSYQYLVSLHLMRPAALLVATIIACGTAVLVYAAGDNTNEVLPPPPNSQSQRE